VNQKPKGILHHVLGGSKTQKELDEAGVRTREARVTVHGI
jgi:hypothetical protein